MNQKIKELGYLQDTLRNATVNIKYHSLEVEKIIARISDAVKDYAKTWEDEGGKSNK